MAKMILFESDYKNNVFLLSFTNEDDELYIEMYNDEQREFSHFMTFKKESLKDFIKHLDTCLNEME